MGRNLSGQRPARVRRAVAALAIAGLALLTAQRAPALERRRDQFGKDFGYFFYPIASEVPGLGLAQGVGATVLNLGGTDTDFTGFYLRGDFDASGYALLDVHLLPKRLVLDVGYFDFHVAPVSYGRGMESSPNDYILPTAEGAYGVAQVTLTFLERRLELYQRWAQGQQRLIEVRDKGGDPFEAVDTSRHTARLDTTGGSADYTDDRLDPRVGVRAEVARKTPYIGDRLNSDFYVMDYSVTGYLPFRQWDTFVLNAFQSDAAVTSRGVTNYATLQSAAGLGCQNLPPGPAQEQCLATESDFLDQRLAGNRYGTATSLGGTQRLRSYPNGRFYAGHSQFAGVEYRWNLTDERTPFDIFIARGIRTGLQVAFFAETGTVADRTADLWKVSRGSYGVGFRVVLSGVVLRADWANGDEGSQFQLFINYPWSMFSVDNPG